MIFRSSYYDKVVKKRLRRGPYRAADRSRGRRRSPGAPSRAHPANVEAAASEVRAKTLSCATSAREYLRLGGQKKDLRYDVSKRVLRGGRRVFAASLYDLQTSWPSVRPRGELASTGGVGRRPRERQRRPLRVDGTGRRRRRGAMFGQADPPRRRRRRGRMRESTRPVRQYIATAVFHAGRLHPLPRQEGRQSTDHGSGSRR